MDTSFIPLDQIVPNDTPVSDPGILSYANQQLSSGLSPDDAMQATFTKYGEGLPVDFVYDPTSKAFKENTTSDSSGFVPLDSLPDSGTPIHASPQASTDTSAVPDSTGTMIGKSLATGVQTGLVNPLNNLESQVYNFLTHPEDQETIDGGKVTPQQKAAAKLIGANLGDTWGSILKASPTEIAQHQATTDTLLGIDTKEQEARSKAVASGDVYSGPVEGLLQHSAVRDLFNSVWNPNKSNTLLHQKVNMIAHLQDITQNPSKYTKDQVQSAQKVLDFYKTQAGKSTWQKSKDTISGIEDKPLTLVNSLTADPELFLAPEAKIGDALYGTKVAAASEAAQRAENLSKLAEHISSAADKAPEIQEAASAQAKVYSDLAKQALRQATKLKYAQRSANVASSAAGGAALNVGITAEQEKAEQGFVPLDSLGAPAILGATLGGGLSVLHGEGKTENKFFPDIPESSPGHPLAENPPIEKGSTVPYTGAVHSSGQYVHIDKNFPETLDIPNKQGKDVTVPVTDIVGGVHEVEEGKLMHPVSPIGEEGLNNLVSKMGRFYNTKVITPSIAEKIIQGKPLSYPDAHEIATAIENNYVETTYDIDPEVYQKALKPHIKEIAERAQKEPQSDRPVGIDTKPYDDMGHPEEVAQQGVSGGPTGRTGGPKASKGRGKKVVTTPTPKIEIPDNYATSGLSSVLGKMDMFGNAKKFLPLAALSGALYGYGQVTGDKRAKGAMFLPALAMAKFKEDIPDRIDAFEAMEEGNFSPDDIHAVTGLYRDPDSKIIGEISDKGMSVNTERMDPHVPYALEDVVSHPHQNTFLKDVFKGTKIQRGGNGAYFDTETKTIHIPGSRGLQAYLDEGTTLPQLVAHELQHAVQDYYGQQKGANPEAMEQIIDQNIYELSTRLSKLRFQQKLATSGKDIPNQAHLDILANKIRKTRDAVMYLEFKKKALAYLMYQRSAGESAAYATESRIGMDDAFRAKRFPEIDMPAKLEEQWGKSDNLLLPEDTISNHLLKSGEMDEDGKLRGMAIPEDKIPDEVKVVEAAKNGDQKAISSLYKQYMPRLNRTIAGIVRNKAAALGLEPEDIAQTAFFRAIRALPNFRGDSSFYTYLYMIGKNEALKALQQAKNAANQKSIFHTTSEGEGDATLPLSGKDEDLVSHNEKVPLLSSVENIEDKGGTPEEQAIAQQASKIIGHVIENLPEDIKATVKLKEFVGMTNEEIAQAQGIPLGTVKSRLFNAEKLVRESLESGAGARFRKQQGFATPEALKKLLKTSLLLTAGATLGAKFSSDKKHGALAGAALGLFLGRLSPRDVHEGIRDAFSPSKRINVNDLLNSWDARREEMHLTISRVQYAIDKWAPSKESQTKITYWLDGQKVQLTPDEQKAANLARNFYNTILEQGLQSGVLKDSLSDYVNHEWGNSKMAQKLQEELSNSFPTNMSPKDRHALARKFLTLEKGKQAGLVPKTENINELIGIYGRSMARAMANKSLLEGLKSRVLSVRNGITAVMPATKAPYNFVSINHPQLAGVRVSPDIAPSLRFLFHQTGGGTLSALEGLNIALKREETGLSLFHPYALSMAFLTANPWRNLLANAGELGKSFVGKSKGHEALLSPNSDYEAVTQGLIRNGLKVTFRKGALQDEDINTGFYQGLDQLQRFMDATIPGGKGAIGLVKKAYRLSDKVVWENVHTGTKMVTAMNAYEQLLRNWQSAVNKGKVEAMPSREELFRQAAAYTNDTFGGLNWRRIADDATTRLGKSLGHILANPVSRRILQVVLFAPDWTLSTIRSFTQAFGKGSGLSGVIKPKMLADLHRQYLLRNAILYFTLYNGLNYALSGHYIWDNKDPLTVDMGNGERLQINKHFMEVPHAIANPGKFALGKLGTIPSELLEQSLGVEYLTPGHMPPMKDRLTHLGERFVPFFASTGAREGPEAAMFSLAGLPVYGGHAPLSPEERMEKEQRKKASARKAARTREEKEMHKLMSGQY